MSTAVGQQNYWSLKLFSRIQDRVLKKEDDFYKVFTKSRRPKNTVFADQLETFQTLYLSSLILGYFCVFSVTFNTTMMIGSFLFQLVDFLAVYRYRNVILSLMLGSLVIYFYKILFFSIPSPAKENNSNFLLVDAESEAGSVAYKNKWVGFPHLTNVNCKAALNRSISNSLYPKSLTRVAASVFAQDSLKCTNFLRKYGFQRFPQVSEEEREFPLAFIILFHKDLDQVLFLLRAIYRPQNIYCLSVDLNSDISLINSVRSVTTCFDNVFLVKKLEPIVYAGFSRLKADLHCMEELVAAPVKWKYLFNMPGQQFPLRTNLEIVRILKIYNGANDELGMSGKRSLPRRYKVKHHVIIDRKTGKHVVAETVGRNPPPPHNFRIVKGSAYGTFSRAFVEFVLKTRQAQDLIEWSRDIESPDEYVWSTLHHTDIMVVPGGYTGEPDAKRAMTTFVAWEREVPCATIYVRWICIFSTEDLPMLARRQELFANKFYIDHHPTALHCMDEFIFNLTVTNTIRDLSFYRDLAFIRRG